MPQTASIALRRWTPDDAPRMVELLNNSAVYRYLSSGLPLPYRLEHALGFISACSNVSHMVERAIVCEAETVGTIGATLEGRRATIGYWLGEAYQRRGIMSAALPLFINELPGGVSQLVARVFDFNPASIALLQKAGFTMSGTMEEEPAKDGLRHPVLTFRRTR